MSKRRCSFCGLEAEVDHQSCYLTSEKHRIGRQTVQAERDALRAELEQTKEQLELHRASERVDVVKLRAELHTCKVELSNVRDELEPVKRSLDLCREDRKTLGTLLGQAKGEADHFKHFMETAEKHEVELRALVRELVEEADRLYGWYGTKCEATDELLQRAREALKGEP